MLAIGGNIGQLLSVHSMRKNDAFILVVSRYLSAEGACPSKPATVCTCTNMYTHDHAAYGQIRA